MRKKILGTFIIVITILTFSFVMITNNSLISAMLIQHETNLTNEVRMTEDLLKASYQSNFDFQAFCENIHDRVNARVTIINGEGIVLADSDEDPKVMNNHLNREEIIETNETGQPATAKRFSNTLKTDYLYVAQKTNIEGANYFIRISKPLFSFRFRSRRIILKLSFFNFRISSFSVSASPGTVIPGNFSRELLIPSRIIGWSSTIIALISSIIDKNDSKNSNFMQEFIKK